MFIKTIILRVFETVRDGHDPDTILKRVKYSNFGTYIGNFDFIYMSFVFLCLGQSKTTKLLLGCYQNYNI